MDNETFRILARHFGNAEHIQVNFKPGACPATNGKEIILPDDLQCGGDIMLSALLHECGHVSLTDFDVRPDTVDPAELFPIINALEDIRIDTVTAAKYPAARDFSRAALVEIINTRAADLKAEPHALRMLKGIIIHGMGAADLLPGMYDAQTAALIEPLARDFNGRAIAAANTRELEPLARELAARIMATNPKPRPEAQQRANAAQKAQEAAQKAQGEAKAAREKHNQTAQDGQSAYTKYKNARAQRRANETKARKAEHEARIAEAKGLTREAARAKAEAQKCKERAEQYAKTESEQADQTNKARAEHNATAEACNKANAAEFEKRNEANAAQKALDADMAQDFTPGNGQGAISLSGFESIDLDALRNTSAVTVRGNLAEVIKAALISKRDANEANDSGRMINARALPEYQTADPETFFIDQERRDYMTRISFLVDCSGSMGNIDDDRPGRQDSGATMAIDALAALLDAAKAAIHGGAPGEVTAYVFGDHDAAYPILTSIDAYTGRAALAQAFNTGRGVCGQGTEIIPAINRVAEDLKNYPDHEHIVIVMTDADFDEHDAQALRNQTITDGRVVFLGINASLEHKGRTARRAIFGKYNITDAASAPAILRRAFLDAIA